MKGLLLKDILSLRKYMRTLLLMAAVYAALTYFVDSSAFLSGMIVLMCAMVPVTSFTLDHQAGWNVYELSLPISRKDIVRGKYLLALLFTLFGAGIAIAVGLLFSVLNRGISLPETLTLSYALFAVGLIFASILLPLVFKFGPEKARLMVIAVFAVPTAAFVALTSAGSKLPDTQFLNLLFLLSPLILAIVLTLSYLASRAIYEKKEI